MSSRHAPRWLPLLLGVFCALWLVTAPRAAFAGAGLCDARAISVELPGPLACVEIAVIAGVADEDVAGFCDLRGATGIAPRPALQGSDGFLDVGPGCNPGVRSGTSIERDAPPPIVVDASPIDRLAPSTDPLALAPPFSVEISFPDHDAYALPRGFRRDVEHPPRALVDERARTIARGPRDEIAAPPLARADPTPAAVDTRGLEAKKARPSLFLRSHGSFRADARGTSRSTVVRFSSKERK